MSLLFCTKSAGDTPTGPGGGSNPVAGANVRAGNDVVNTFSKGITDADGNYSLPVEFGVWKVYAWKEREYNDNVYHLRMGIPSNEDYNPFSASLDGAVVKNFVWQLQGKIPSSVCSIKRVCILKKTILILPFRYLLSNPRYEHIDY